MNLLLRIAGKRLPEFLKKRELKKLFRLTALAFGNEIPSLRNLSYEDCLEKYAWYTKTAADQCISEGKRMQDVSDRLFQLALDKGRFWRKIFQVSEMNDVMEAARIIYNAIGIEFNGTYRGAIEIETCYFSQFYSPAVCRLIASLDAGIMAGLSNGGILSFSHRITEGSKLCKAQLCLMETKK